MRIGLEPGAQNAFGHWNALFAGGTGFKISEPGEGMDYLLQRRRDPRGAGIIDLSDRSLGAVNQEMPGPDGGAGHEDGQAVLSGGSS